MPRERLRLTALQHGQCPLKAGALERLCAFAGGCGTPMNGRSDTFLVCHGRLMVRVVQGQGKGGPSGCYSRRYYLALASERYFRNALASLSAASSRSSLLHAARRLLWRQDLSEPLRYRTGPGLGQPWSKAASDALGGNSRSAQRREWWRECAARRDPGAPGRSPGARGSRRLRPRGSRSAECAVHGLPRTATACQRVQRPAYDGDAVSAGDPMRSIPSMQGRRGRPGALQADRSFGVFQR